jgi:hypothetical protein
MRGSRRRAIGPATFAGGHLSGSGVLKILCEFTVPKLRVLLWWFETNKSPKNSNYSTIGA